MHTTVMLAVVLGFSPVGVAQSGIITSATRLGPHGPITPTVHRTVIHVPGDHSTIQAAIAAAPADGLVLVAPGAYVENLDFLGKNIEVRSDQDGVASTDDLAPLTTIIDGSSPVNPDLGSVVSFVSGEGHAAVLRGFTLTGGTGTYLPSYFSYNGGGVFCSNSSPTISENIITGNIVGDSGFYTHGAGGIACQVNASPTISENVISNNVVDVGIAGGIGCGQGCAPLITGNTITGNTALGTAGGGVLCTVGSAATIENNTISLNTSLLWGGGVFIYGCDVVLRGNVINDNSSGEGGGIYTESSTTMIVNNIVANNLAGRTGAGVNCFKGWNTLTNNTIYGNAGTDPNYLGGGLYVWGFQPSSGHTIDVRNSIIYNNFRGNGYPGDVLRFIPDTLTVEYTDVSAWIGYGIGNIDADPLLVDPANGDWHLSVSSPCLDVGNNLAPGIHTTDFEGDPRILDGDAIPGAVVDMGADERLP